MTFSDIPSDASLFLVRESRDIDLLAFGQNSLDRVGRIEELPPPGGKSSLVSYGESPGGQVATAALAAAKLGLRCAYMGRVGDDAAAEAVLAPLAAAGVDLSAVQRVEGATTRLAIVLVDPGNGERTVLWHRDPRLELGASGLPDFDLDRVGTVLLDTEDVASSTELARRARSHGVPVVLDVDTFTPELQPLLRLVDFPIVTEQFAATFSGTDSAVEGLARLDAAGARLAVVTLGERGAMASARGRRFACPAFETHPVDTTGAGDAFRAGFVWALQRGEGAEAALRTASATGALCCSGPGAQGGLPDAPALQRFLREGTPGPWRGPWLGD